ncbi:hypothetical protein RA307_28290 [Xanthobacteraceae bacterium Astr-EGSB]|uniref:hypothetical protein n=1 Tax=Astrobacterium formosum TaxID=3069710 RepID=UPI0027B374F7|nr:hypothetical protein [Xanthobacteraceae bacterium Astr-EGSB]
MPNDNPRRLPVAATHPLVRLAELEGVHIREVPDFLRLWQLCSHAACRRGRYCHGGTRACLAVAEVHMPPPVREWYDAVIEAFEEGFTIIGAYEFARPFAPAMITWRAALRAAEVYGERDRLRGDARG